ncbi:hypothetical protein [Maricaulis parjimensis]|uniref:hypothetical protein n=1 Tax=Maricaulis parjimensis TaxID=144023 RepID=UPI001939FE82|nr:hypothetical protein [Maricaulis parjimensis]
MKDYLEPVFMIFTGLGFMAFLAAMLQVRAHLKGLSGACLKAAILCLPLALLAFAWAGKENTLNKATPFILGGGGIVFAALLLLAGGLVLWVREQKA